MDEDTFVLSTHVSQEVLVRLNDTRNSASSRILFIYRAIEYPPGIDEVQNWITALKSGKRIVNPMAPRQEFYQYYNQLSPAGKKLIDRAVEILAKEYHDVQSWLDIQN